MRDPYSLSVSLSLLYAHQPGANLRLRASIGLSLTIIQSVTYQSFLCTACAGGRERASGEGKGGVVVDNVCKFVREHPVPCNKYTVLFCLLLCLLIHSSLSSTPVRFFSFQNTLQTFTLLHLLFVYLPIHPCIHPSPGWQWCRAEKLWIIHQAGLFFPSLLPTFVLLWCWRTFGDVHATNTCTFTKDLISNLHGCIDCSVHVCYVV